MSSSTTTVMTMIANAGAARTFQINRESSIACITPCLWPKIPERRRPPRAAAVLIGLPFVVPRTTNRVVVDPNDISRLRLDLLGGRVWPAEIDPASALLQCGMDDLLIGEFAVRIFDVHHIP